MILDEAELIGAGRGEPGGRDAAEDGLRRATLAALYLQLAVGKPDIDRADNIAGFAVVVGGGGVVAAQSAQPGGRGVGGFALLRRQRPIDKPTEVGQHRHFTGDDPHDSTVAQLLEGRRARNHIDWRRAAQNGQRNQQLLLGHIQPPPEAREERPYIGPRVQPVQFGQVVAAV